ncbi:MAG: TIGR00725 family protein [Hyphomicrobiales bacterium]|nr:TIGR00725 family protein [Hyphomicrobiales bacterium]MCP5370354.1 TIGR00725 family protein [Hyphomicrobiales bacterium]
MPTLFLRADRGLLHDGRRLFDPRSLAWRTPDGTLPDGEPVTPAAAVRWLYTESGGPRVPVGVIGPREATARQVEVAERLGRRLGELRVLVLNGGKTGVMEAVSRGCVQAGGQVLGFVPDPDWRDANDFVTIPLATGIGPARNVLIARASLALVAIGGEYGTLTEMAFGLHFDKPVFALEGAPRVDGVRVMEDVDQVVEALVAVILGLDA